MRGNRIYLFVFLIAIITGCNKNENCGEGTHNKILISNISSEELNCSLLRPDSTYFINGEEIGFLIDPFKQRDYAIRGETCWQEYFNSLNNGYEYFFVFDNDTVKAIGWEAISGTERGLLKRVKVDLNYLEANNFTITYP